MSQRDKREIPSQQQLDIQSLSENFNKEQEKVSALKELVRKSEKAHGKSTYSTKEKVKDIAKRLTNLKSKAKSRHSTDNPSSSPKDVQYESRSTERLDPSQSSTISDPEAGEDLSTTSRMETPGRERVLLLRRQMEENKAKLAERENNKREIQQMVTQLKAKFDTTQQCLEHSSELGRSMGDLSALSYASVRDKVRSATDLASTSFNLDKERIKFLDNRVRLLEKQLEKEKNSSEASKRVKELENKVLDLEECLRESRNRDLVAALNDRDVEESWQIENDHLKTEIEEKSRKILHLEETNDILETVKSDLTEKTQDLEARLKESEEKQKSLESQIEAFKDAPDNQQFEVVDECTREQCSELSLQVQELRMKNEQLEQENDALRRENNLLQEKLSLDEENDQLDEDSTTQENNLQKQLERITALEEELMEKTIELNVLNANYAVLEEKLNINQRKPLFATEAEGNDEELKNELREMKRKHEKLEKQLHEFKRISDVHASMVELTEEVEELQQKITELEDEKGQLQLKLVNGERTTTVTQIEIEKKVEYLEAACQSQNVAIQLLEELKMDVSDDLENTKSELESTRVVSEMQSIHLEEQVNSNLQKIRELEVENEHLHKTVDDLQEEKDSLNKKVDHYLTENMELLDKIEKFNKSSSSAESIEIVERLTHQDQLEIEAFNKQLEKNKVIRPTKGDHENRDYVDAELNENVTRLKEERSELIHKIELFTTERKEVLDKMEILTNESSEHLEKIKQIREEHSALQQQIQDLNAEKDNLQLMYDSSLEAQKALQKEIQEISEEKSRITTELNSMMKVSALTNPTGNEALLEKCEKTLSKLNTELENYKKVKDKNAIVSASKKLCKEAKNAHQQVTELLRKLKETASSPRPEIPDNAKVTELETMVTNLRLELIAAVSASEEKDVQIERLNEEMRAIQAMSDKFDRLIEDKDISHEKQIQSLNDLRLELESKIKTSDGEMKILQDLIAEQKQQLIEAYSDNETQVAQKIRELEEREQEISKLKSELQLLQQNSTRVGQDFNNDLTLEIEKLKEALSINKSLLSEQIDELSNKQETIDTLNAQIMELYKTMEENTNKVFEKEDEIVQLQDQIQSNKLDLEKLTEENTKNKTEVDKLLLELRSNKASLEKLAELATVEEDNLSLKEENQILEENLQISELQKAKLEEKVKSLETQNKEQVEKMKKYIANLKKKVLQCQEFEAEIKVLKQESSSSSHLMDLMSKVVQQISSFLPEIREQRRNIETAINNFQGARERFRQEKHNLREQVNDKTTQITSLKQTLNEKSRILNETTENLTNQISLLQEQLQAKSTESNEQASNIQTIELSQKEIQNLRNQLRDQAQRLEEQSALAQDDVLVLREQLKEKVTALEELSNEIQNLKEQANSELFNELASLREELHKKDKEIQKQNSLLDTTEEQLNTLQDEIQRKTIEIQHLNEQVKLATSANEAQLKNQGEISQLETKIEELTKDLKARNLKFEKSKAVIKEKNREIQRLYNLLNKQTEEEQQITPVIAPKPSTSQPPPQENKLQIELENMRRENQQLRDVMAAERVNFNETKSRLETLYDGIQAKLQEDMSYIETLEQENNVFRTKIIKLEECVGTFEERRASMESRVNILNDQLQERADEHAKAEDELVYRLTMLSQKDELIGQRLLTSQKENESLTNSLENLKADYNNLLAKHAKLESEYTNFRDNTRSDLEAENNSLNAEGLRLTGELVRLRVSYEEKLTAKQTEIDELENDLSEQLQINTSEKRAILEELERTKDELNAQKDEQVRMSETINSLEQSKADLERESTWIKMQNESLSQDQFELQELRIQSIQDKTELENLKHQIDVLVQNHEIETNALRKQITELDSIRMQVSQNQTDDQVFIETENKRLTDLLAEKESLIENYQRQNIQLQMNALVVRQQPTDAFPTLPPPTDPTQLAQLKEKCDRLERELNEKQREIERLRNEQPQVLVPPPEAFFGTEQNNPSVFDEIVSVRHIDNLHGSTHSRAMVHPPLVEEATDNQPTIEDLQRNVSDLEKHAQDLETKLSLRIAAHEDSLRQLEDQRASYESELKLHQDRIRELELKETTKAVESQIIPAQPTPSLDMFFKSAPEESPFEHIARTTTEMQPVVEEQIVPKRTYLCEPSNQQVDFDEGWAWGSEEAALEAKHFASTSHTSLIPPHQQLELKLQDSQERIQELEQERDRLEQQKQEMQVKTTKLVKKLKEYKTKVDELNSQAAFRKSSSVESSDLDLAIQEEMKTQLRDLEQKLSDAKKQIDKQSLEKENLLKRIDVLTVGNDRMTEMKERQDNDVHMYQTRIRELTEKLRSLEEWNQNTMGRITPDARLPSTSAPSAPTELLEKKIEDLLSNIEDISSDKSELQALLDDERASVQKAENTIKTLQEKIARLENASLSDNADQKFQINELKLENQNLKAQLSDSQEFIQREKTERLAEINTLVQQSEDLNAQIAKLKLDVLNSKDLEANFKQLSVEKEDLIHEIEALRMELTFARPQPQTEPSNELAHLKQRLDEVLSQNQQLQEQIKNINHTAELESLKIKNDELTQEINILRREQVFKPQDQGEIAHMVANVARLEKELQDKRQRNDDLQVENNHIRMESAFSAKLDQEYFESEKLASKLNQLKTQVTTVKMKNEELTREIERRKQSSEHRIEQLEQEVQRLSSENKSLTTQLDRHNLETSSSAHLTELESQIQEKDSEITHLKHRIEDLMREDQTEKLVLEILSKNQEIHMLKMQVKNLEDDKHDLEHNLTLQITQELNTKRAAESDQNQQLKSELEALREEKVNMEKELEVLNNHVLSTLQNEEKMKANILELDTKNIEIAELRRSLEAIKAPQSPPDVTAINAQWEAVIEQRCNEIATMWRDHLESRESEFNAIISKLQQEIADFKATSNASDAHQIPSPPVESADNNDLQQMQKALENQEIEIVTLKEQLAIRSAEYARLVAQYEPHKLQSTMSSSDGTSSEGLRRPDTADLVPKSELDLTLYMLHQRDMRCEELTLELVNLLDERDTLQLKLSNTLRQVEMIKSQHVAAIETSKETQLPPQQGPETSQTSTSPSAANTDNLNQKLTELQSVSHSKDKRIQEEREQRNRQMEKLQQDVAKMPSEALAELIGTAQPNHSPSSVLFNWLWGNSSGPQS